MTTAITETRKITDAFRVDGARALVTGASRGIGQAVAVALAEAGARLALSARTAQGLKDTADRVAAYGQSPVLAPADLAEPTAASLVDRAAAELGGLDIVVHNAGILPTEPDGAPRLLPLQALPQQDWDAYPYLADSGAGSLVLMSSVAGVVGTPMMESYAASKAAEISLARSLAVGWARAGVRVNALCPGWTRTAMTAFAYSTEPISDWLLAHVPIGRWAEPREVAAAALFLASPASAYLTGQALVLDGGLSVADGGLAGIPKPPSPFAAG
jgi:NAD(P)-dependent dehydrogenase (short-subunit alcohol dehydrogenase family)